MMEDLSKNAKKGQKCEVRKLQYLSFPTVFNKNAKKGKKRHKKRSAEFCGKSQNISTTTFRTDTRHSCTQVRAGATFRGHRRSPSSALIPPDIYLIKTAPFYPAVLWYRFFFLSAAWRDLFLLLCLGIVSFS